MHEEMWNLHNISPAIGAHGWSEGESGEIDGGRAEHLQGLPDGLLVEHRVGRVAVLNALEVLVLGPQRVAGALGSVSGGWVSRRGSNVR